MYILSVLFGLFLIAVIIGIWVYLDESGGPGKRPDPADPQWKAARRALGLPDEE